MLVDIPVLKVLVQWMKTTKRRRRSKGCLSPGLRSCYGKPQLKLSYKGILLPMGFAYRQRYSYSYNLLLHVTQCK